MIAPRASRPDPWRQSVIRWAAMLYANGYDVLAADRRDFSAEDMAGYGYPTSQQALGWKESEDVLAAGRYLAAKRGVLDVGLVGFSEGGQNTVLALALDRGHVFAAGLQFSGPADQDTQIYSTAVPAGCQTPAAGGSSGRSSSTSRRSSRLVASRKPQPQAASPKREARHNEGQRRVDAMRSARRARRRRSWRR